MKALLIAVNWKHETVHWQLVEGDNPIVSAHELQASLESDFRNVEWLIIGDAEACAVNAKAYLSAYGINTEKSHVSYEYNTGAIE